MLKTTAFLALALTLSTTAFAQSSAQERAKNPLSWMLIKAVCQTSDKSFFVNTAVRNDLKYVINDGSSVNAGAEASTGMSATILTDTSLKIVGDSLRLELRRGPTQYYPSLNAEVILEMPIFKIGESNTYSGKASAIVKNASAPELDAQNATCTINAAPSEYL